MLSNPLRNLSLPDKCFNCGVELKDNKGRILPDMVEALRSTDPTAVVESWKLLPAVVSRRINKKISVEIHFCQREPCKEKMFEYIKELDAES